MEDDRLESAESRPWDPSFIRSRISEVVDENWGEYGGCMSWMDPEGLAKEVCVSKSVIDTSC